MDDRHTQCSVDGTGWELKDVQRWFAAIVDSSNDAIISKSLDGVISTWNAAAERLLGYSAKEAVGQPITIIIPPELHDEEKHILKRLRAGERIEHYETCRVTREALSSALPKSCGTSRRANEAKRLCAKASKGSRVRSPLQERCTRSAHA